MATGASAARAGDHGGVTPRRPILLACSLLAAAAAGTVALVGALQSGDSGPGAVSALHTHAAALCIDQGAYVTVQMRIHNQGPAGRFRLTAYEDPVGGPRRTVRKDVAMAADAYPPVAIDVPLVSGDRTPGTGGRYCGVEGVTLLPDGGGGAGSPTTAP